MNSQISSNLKRWRCGGTPYYLPPETVQGKAFDVSADWWQLGVVAWEMVERKCPFTDVSVEKIYHHINNRVLTKPNSMSIPISFYHVVVGVVGFLD